MMNHFRTHTRIISRYYLRRTLTSKTRSRLEDLKKEWNVSVGKTDDEKAYTIKLNNQNLKTPFGNLVRIKDETLALGLANEWKSQGSYKKIDLKTMHLTTLTYDAIDNPFKESKEETINSIIEYLKFDTLRFRDVENEELMKKQSRHWDPIIGWFEHKYNCHLPIEYGDLSSSGSLPTNTQDTIYRLLLSHDRWPLIGIKFVTQNLKSLVLATSLAERFLEVKQAVDLARLETTHQTEKWTKVEWQHDIDEQCTNSRVAAGSLFYHLSI